jgi:hypothetical protein
MAYDDGARRGGDRLLGCQVFTTDGMQLGRVKEVQGDVFQVAAPRQLEYWLPTSTIASRLGERLTLVLPAERLAHYRTRPPRAA